MIQIPLKAVNLEHPLLKDKDKLQQLYSLLTTDYLSYTKSLLMVFGQQENIKNFAKKFKYILCGNQSIKIYPLITRLRDVIDLIDGNQEKTK